jgi:hypothetical protein
MYTKEREREMWREEKGRERKHSQGEKKKKGITKRVFTVRETMRFSEYSNVSQGP